MARKIRDQGSALISVIFLMAIVAIISVSVITVTMFSMSNTVRQIQASRVQSNIKTGLAEQSARIAAMKDSSDALCKNVATTTGNDATEKQDGIEYTYTVSWLSQKDDTTVEDCTKAARVKLTVTGISQDKEGTTSNIYQWSPATGTNGTLGFGKLSWTTPPDSGETDGDLSISADVHAKWDDNIG